MNEHEKLYWGFLTSKDNPNENLGINPNFIEISKPEMYLASCMNILRHAYGFMESAKIGSPVDGSGTELPLYSYAAIEYLTQFDFSGKRVFEFGAGGSTLYWMRRAREVVSVENDGEWCRKLTPKLSANARLIFAEGDSFAFTIRNIDGEFDVIVVVVDSAGYRYDCATEAVAKLARGGIIILDNSDWHPATAAMVKGHGLLQVDMTGFKPCESHTSTTSIFFHREFDFPILADRQPVYGIGAKRVHSGWDRPYAKPPS